MDLAKDVYQGAVSAESVVRRCSVKKVLLKNLQENICAGVSLFFNKVAGLHLTPTQECFPVNFTKFLRIPFFIEPLRWLLLRLFLKRYQMLAPVKFLHIF